VNARFGAGVALVKNADEVRIRIPARVQEIPAFVAQLETLTLQPERAPQVIINERTGTVLAGGGVDISSIVISQGDINVTIMADSSTAQPSFVSGFGTGECALVVTDMKLAQAGSASASVRFPQPTVADLVQALAQSRVNTRRTISILQAIRAAGALNADIVVQ
jgi:flagellar P-ring protein precursor FlgI